MGGNEVDSSWSQSVPAMERILELAINGLSKMDSELLMRQACICREWELKGGRLPISHAERARLSWKLLLLDRLLRQTRTNLNVLGLQPRQYSGRDRYREPTSMEEIWHR